MDSTFSTVRKRRRNNEDLAVEAIQNDLQRK